MSRPLLHLGAAALILLIAPAIARADNPPPASQSTIQSQDEPSFKDKLINDLPAPISDGLDVDAWGWFADSQNHKNFYDAEVSLGITKSFDQRIAIGAQGNFIDANGTRRGELEKGYVSALLSEDAGTILTIGKFNASFGVEGRDFWERTTGTTSLLFGAQPQDLFGLMITQPVGDSGITLRPFLSSDFEGQYNFNQSPSVGMTTEYRPTSNLDLALTTWAGPGLVLFGGRPMHSPYTDEDYGQAAVIGNWEGPNVYAESGGTLYFLDGKAVWQLRPDLTFSAEYLIASTCTSNGHWGWWGCMGLLDYDLTDRWHLFGRYSFLDDSDWLITGEFQRDNEFSGGVGFKVLDGLELRGEYRHDIGSETGSANTFSAHLTFTY